MQNMKVEIWSDVACPWCYIGKRRFESALAGFEHRDQVEIIWRSYQLDPSAPKTSDTLVNEVLAKKYGITVERAKAMNTQLAELGAQEGLEYHFEKTHYTNTFDAHRLIHLAAIHNLQDVAKERLLHAYFVDGASVGDIETLVKLAAEIGLDPEEARAVLNSDAYADKVKADIQRARLFGIQGVPFFAIDEIYGVSGAQPTEVFSEVLTKAWADSHPLVKIGNVTQGAGTCEGDSCAI